MFDFASYHRAATLADAINLLADNPQAKLLAGGTDVLIQLHHHNDRYRHIVDIHNLAELRGITLAEDGSLRIGSATTFTQLIEDPITQRHLPALCAAATSIAGPQIRNVATYGGNICNGATRRRDLQRGRRGHAVRPRLYRPLYGHRHREDGGRSG